MHFISKKFSFGLVVALLLAWGMMGLLLIESGNQLLQAQIIESGSAIKLPKGVRLRLDVDKNVYRETESVLISIRNDSRTPVWLAEHSDGCAMSWWRIEQQHDTDQWETVALRRLDCQSNSYGQVEFLAHTIKTDSWDGLAQTADIGQIFRHVPTGTFRISVPFLYGTEASVKDWSLAKAVVSAPFTVQGQETES